MVSDENNSQPKVLFVIDHLDTGGAPVVARDLINGLVALGARVSLVVLSDRVRYALPPEVEVVKCCFRPEGFRQKFNRYAIHARMLDELIAEKGYSDSDLVVAHLHHAHQLVKRSTLAGRAWYCLHADPEAGFLGKKRGLARVIKRHKVRRLYQQRRLIGVSHGILDSLSKTFGVSGDPGVAIHNPLDLEKIQRDSREVADDVPEAYLLYVGRLEQVQKRFDRLLKSYHDSDVSIPLVLIGEGADSRFIESEVERLGLQERVILLGHRDNPYAYMSRAQALVLSSDYEGFPLVLIESLACGTPVVSTDCPTGPREILTDSFSRYLVPMEDPKAFAALLREMADNPPQVPEDVVSHLAAEQVARRYLSLAQR